MNRRWAFQGEGPATGPPEGAIETLLVAHTMQLSEDTKRGGLEGTSYNRAMFSAYEGNQSFLDEQKVIAEELKRLGGANVQPLKSSDLPVVEMTGQAKGFYVKPDAGEKSSGDHGAKHKASGTNTLAGHLTPSADKEVGYYRVGLVSYEGKDLVAAWDGQFLCKVDAKEKRLEMLMYKFKPEFTDECLADLKTNNMSSSLKAEMRKNLSRYELSRQFMINLPLSDISRFCLSAPNGKCGHGFLIMECTSKVNFAQRHIATNLSNHNQWKQRVSIFSRESASDSPESASASPQHLILGTSNCRDLAIIVAQAMLMEPKLRDLYVEENVVLLPFVPMPDVPDYVDGAEAGTSDASKRAVVQQQKECTKPNDHVEGAEASSSSEQPKGPPRKKFKILPQKSKLRKEVLDMLVLLKIVTREKADEVYTNPQNLEEDNALHKSKINNFLGGLGVETCFNEYLNFNCKSAEELKSLVHQKLDAENRGFDNFEDLGLDSYDEDDDSFDEDDDDEEATDQDKKKKRDDRKRERFNNLTALDLLQKQDVQGDPVFFSYCWGYMDQEDNTSHCTRCHSCQDWRMWHCFNCDQCSYGQSIPECEHCGVHKDELGLCPPLLNGEQWTPIVRPALKKEKNLQGTLHLLHGLLPGLFPIPGLCHSDDSSDDDL